MSAPLDEATKARNIKLYNEFHDGWSNGATFTLPTKEWLEDNVTEDFIFRNNDFPVIESRQAFMDTYAAWGQMISLKHNIHVQYALNDGWVVTFFELHGFGHNADKSGYFEFGSPMCMNRIHVNDAGKIDMWESHWDAVGSKIFEKMAATSA